MHLWTQNDHIPRKFLHSREKSYIFSVCLLNRAICCGTLYTVYLGREQDNLPGKWIRKDNIIFLDINYKHTHSGRSYCCTKKFN